MYCIVPPPTTTHLFPLLYLLHVRMKKSDLLSVHAFQRTAPQTMPIMERRRACDAKQAHNNPSPDMTKPPTAHSHAIFPATHRRLPAGSASSDTNDERVPILPEVWA
eukprot:1159129-Pelagomonas_calceolata.AAC.6